MKGVRRADRSNAAAAGLKETASLCCRADGTSRLVVRSEFTTALAGDVLWKTLRLTVRLWKLQAPRRGAEKRLFLDYELRSKDEGK